jgi:hypothetical protein
MNFTWVPLATAAPVSSFLRATSTVAMFRPTLTTYKGGRRVVGRAAAPGRPAW